MPKPPENDDFRDLLRKKARGILAQAGNIDKELESVSLKSAQELIEELRIYQAELELQNEELRDARRQLENSRDHYYELFDLAPLGYFIIGADSRIAEANLTGADMLGYERRLVLGRDFRAHVVEDFVSRWDALLSDLRHDPYHHACELPLNHREGHTIWAHLESAPLSKDGEHGRFLLAVSDVSAERKAQCEAEHMRSLVDSSHTAIVAVDLQGRVTSWNAGAETLYAYSEKDMLGESITRLNPKDYAGRFESMLHAVVRGESPDELQIEQVGKNGELIPVTLWISPIRDIKGDIVGLSGVSRDRSRQLAEEDERARIETSLRTMLDVFDGFMFVVFDGAITFVNARLREYLAGEDNPKAKRFFSSVLRSMPPAPSKTHKAQRWEYYDEDLEAWFLASASPLAMPGGGIAQLTMLIDITIQKHAEHEAKRNLDLLPSIYDTAEVGICLTNQEGRFLKVNQRYCDFYGYTEKELIGQHFTMVVPHSFREEACRLHDAFLETGTEVPREWTVQRKDGSRAHIYVRASRMTGEDGQPIKLTTIIDISDRKAMEEELRETEEYHRSLFDLSPVWLVLADKNGNIADANTAFCTSLGRSLEEVCAFSLRDVVPPGEHDALDPHWSKAVEDGRFGPVQTHIVVKDGRVAPVVLSASRLERGGKTFLLASMYDLTQQMRTEEALERFRFALDSSPDAVFVTDLESMRFLDINEAACRKLGYTREELLGMGPAQIKPRLSLEELRSHYERVGSSPGSYVSIETCHRRKDGTEYPVEVLMGALESEDHTLVVSTTHDISERKRSEEALREAIRKAEAASEAKGNFLANMSHEIRTPLNGVLGMAQLLLNTELSEEQRSYADTIVQSGEALINIINDVLDFSKIEADRLVLEPVAFDLESALSAMIQIFIPPAEEKGLELVLRYAPIAPRVFVADPGRVRQILTNLVSNAVKFTERGYVLVDVDIAGSVPAAQLEHAKDPDGELAAAIKSSGFSPSDLEVTTLCIQVRDTGIGMGQATLDNIFDVFTQADGSITRRYGGTGLGLAITRRLVEWMGGSISVQSEEGHGTTFSLTLQLVRHPDQPDIIAAKGKGFAWENQKVLLVDSNPVAASVAVELLRSWSLSAHTASSTREALDLMTRAEGEGQPFWAVLVDRRTSGLETTQLMRAKSRRKRWMPHLVTLTTLSQKPDARALEEYGFADCIVKPYTPSRLFDVLAALWMGERPTSANPDQEEEAAAQHASKTGPVSSGRPGQLVSQPHVLLVEDNEVNRAVGRGVLQDLGCLVDEADDGIIAVEMVQEKTYSLVFMDVQMPRMDGLTATKKIREQEAEATDAPHVPIVAMTANVMQGDREKCIEAGMDGYLGKPIRSDGVLEVLQQYVPGYLARQVTREIGRLLLIEENEELLPALVRTFRNHAPGSQLRTARTAIEAHVFIGSFVPNLIVLDPVMPALDVQSLLALLHSDSRYSNTRVLAWTNLPAGHETSRLLRDHGVTVVPGKPALSGLTSGLLRVMQPRSVQRSPYPPSPLDRIASEAAPPSTGGKEAPNASDEPFDRQEALLTIGNNPDRFKRLIELILQDMPKQMAALAKAIDDSDLKEAALRAHTIKGQAATLHAASLQEVALQAELAAKEGRFDDVRNVLQKVACETRRLLDALTNME